MCCTSTNMVSKLATLLSSMGLLYQEAFSVSINIISVTYPCNLQKVADQRCLDPYQFEIIVPL